MDVQQRLADTRHAKFNQSTKTKTVVFQLKGASHFGSNLNWKVQNEVKKPIKSLTFLFS